MVEYITKVSWVKYDADLQEQFSSIDKQIQQLRAALTNKTSYDKRELTAYKVEFEDQIISITKQLQILRAATTEEYFDDEIKRIDSEIEDLDAKYDNRLISLEKSVREIELLVKNMISTKFYRERQAYTVSDAAERVYTISYIPISKSEIVTLNGLELIFGLDKDYVVSGKDIIMDDDLILTVNDTIVIKYDRV